jgi:hypothetical protein
VNAKVLEGTLRVTSPGPDALDKVRATLVKVAA